MSGAPHLSLELWVPGLSKERSGKVCGTVLGLLLLPTECFAIPAMLWFLLWLTRHSNFPIFPALWKEQMTRNASPSRNQHAREDTGWGGCWRETWDKSLEKSGEGWGGSREGRGMCSSFSPLTFQLLEGKDGDKTLRDWQGEKNP